MLIPVECPRQRAPHIQSMTGMSRDSREEDPGAGARVVSRAAGRCQSSQTLLSWRRTLTFTLEGKPRLGFTTGNQASLSCRVRILKSNQYKPKGNLLAHGNENSKGRSLCQVLLEECPYTVSRVFSALTCTLLCSGFVSSHLLSRWPLACLDRRAVLSGVGCHSSSVLISTLPTKTEVLIGPA